MASKGNVSDSYLLIFLAESFSACMETDSKILLDFYSFVMFFKMHWTSRTMDNCDSVKWSKAQVTTGEFLLYLKSSLTSGNFLFPCCNYPWFHLQILLICCLDNRSLHMAPLLRQGTCRTLFSHGWNPVDHLPSFRRNRESAFTAGEFVSKFIQFHLLIAGLLP